jgi:hypothetical protein
MTRIAWDFLRRDRPEFQLCPWEQLTDWERNTIGLADLEIFITNCTASILQGDRPGAWLSWTHLTEQYQ